MRFISCHNGKLQHLAEVGLKTSGERTFRTGIELIDEMAPGGAFVRGAVHELLSDRTDGQAKFFVATLARAACGTGDEPVNSSEKYLGGSPMPLIWCDPKGELYPPALVELGIDLSNVYILQPGSIADENW